MTRRGEGETNSREEDFSEASGGVMVETNGIQ